MEALIKSFNGVAGSHTVISLTGTFPVREIEEITPSHYWEGVTSKEVSIEASFGSLAPERELRIRIGGLIIEATNFRVREVGENLPDSEEENGIVFDDPEKIPL